MHSSPVTRFETSSFSPKRMARNPHIQTVAGFLSSDVEGMDYDRHRLTTADQDFIDVDIPYLNKHSKPIDNADIPILFVLPGFRGNVRGGPNPYLLKDGIRMGFCPIGMNYRGCSGELSHRPFLSHMIDTLEDITCVFDWIKTCYPNRKICVMGCSLGAMFLINLLGRGRLAVQAAVGISPAFNSALGVRYLSGGKYNRFVLNHFKSTIRKREQEFQDVIDIEQALAAQTVVDFDAVCIQSFARIPCVQSYYDEVSPSRWLARIKRPTLLIRAMDDPFFDPADIPFKELNGNPYVTPLITRYGGHVGFFSKLSDKTSWASHQALCFLQQKLGEAPIVERRPLS